MAAMSTGQPALRREEAIDPLEELTELRGRHDALFVTGLHRLVEADSGRLRLPVLSDQATARRPDQASSQRSERWSSRDTRVTFEIWFPGGGLP